MWAVFLFCCFQVPDDEVTEISEATEATDATDISEASDQDNNKKARTHLPLLVLSLAHSQSLRIKTNIMSELRPLSICVCAPVLCRVGMWQKTQKRL